MIVGDLVRWTAFGDIGIIVSNKKGRWKPYYSVYLIYEAYECYIRASELEVIYARR